MKMDTSLSTTKILPSNVLVNTTVEVKKARYQFIKLPYPIKEANALTRTTIALYEAILWFQRNKPDCFPGYEKLKKRAKINSKTTLSLHLKVLQKVGLIKKTRRGKMQSNIYQAMELDNKILQNLQRQHISILHEIAQDDERAAKLRRAKTELKTKKISPAKPQEVKPVVTCIQHREVQVLDSNISSRREDNRYSSNLNKDSKVKIEKKESRGGGFKSISLFLPTTLKSAARSPQSTQIQEISPQADKIPVSKNDPPKTALQPPTGIFKIREVMLKISGDIRDQKHCHENVKQACNIFALLSSREVSEESFIQSMWSARGLTLEIVDLLDKAGAYYFVVLRNIWKVT